MAESRSGAVRLDVVGGRAPRWERLARLDQLDGEGPFALSAGAVDVAVVRRGEAWLALSGLCPHQGALLGEGELEGDELVCRNHGWRFSIESGERRGGRQCLARFPIEARDDGWLWAEVSAAGTSKAATGGRDPDELPGPRPLPLLGNAHQVRADRVHLDLERWSRRYGPRFKFYLGRKRMVALADPELGNQLLKERPGTFRRTTKLEEVFREVGVLGVFGAEGASWRAQRRLAMQALAPRHLRNLYGTLVEVTESLRERWLRAADRGEVLDIQGELMRFTVDVTTSLVFGHGVHSLEDRDHVLQRNLGVVLPEIQRRLLSLFPSWRYVRLPRDRRLDRALVEIRRWIDGLLEETRARLEAEPERAEHPTNFLEAMLSTKDERGKPFEDDLIYGNAITMLLAGEDTTANTLAWAIHHLLDAPEAVGRLRGEVGDRAIAPDEGSARRLRFATAIADEAMRLRPVAPLFFLEALEDTVLGDLALSVGDEVVLLTRMPLLDTTRWEDAERFVPERWLDDDFVAEMRAAHAHIPFGSGPRICPGRSLALLEMQLVLAMLYSTFEVTRVGERDAVTERAAFTMEPVGLRVRLHRRG